MSDNNPFAVLGLAARADLSDDDVRAAWRRLAAATHPDRADGGDPARFAAAAAAYTVLRTRSGRGEALADLTAPAPPPRRAHPPRRTPPAQPSHLGDRAAAGPPPAATRPAAGRLAARIRRGRPARLLLRVAIAAAVSAGAIVVAGAQPATPALIVGALTWLLLTARHDLAPPS
ncbi:MAG TPA: DnaJ domain-containing protein [Streptosporangiaceae bacterium]|jgi:curved DNA-binding protein CbpA